MPFLTEQFRTRRASDAEADELFELLKTEPADGAAAQQLELLLKNTEPEKIDREKWGRVLNRILGQSTGMAEGSGIAGGIGMTEGPGVFSGKEIGEGIGMSEVIGMSEGIGMSERSGISEGDGTGLVEGSSEGKFVENELEKKRVEDDKNENKATKNFEGFGRNKIKEVSEWKDEREDSELKDNEGKDVQRIISEEVESSGVDEMAPPSEVAPLRTMRSRRSFGWVAAASVIVIASLATYFIFLNKPKSEITTTEKPIPTNDVAPGTNKAVLVLGNGSKIILDGAQKGLIANQSGSSVVKTDSGKLAYNASVLKNESTVELNTLTTPRGGQYQLTLPDGTKVWLNAASSIKYPTAFNGKERKVSVTGETYFEVVHNDKQPFVVSVNGLDVKDIGTHFNINAYPDESGIKTTLIEGSIRVTDQKTKNSMLVSPGQQAELSGQNLSVVKNVNTAEVISWKEGSFDFESADLKTILRQFARWYDVEVVYEGTVTNKKFFAIVSRNTSLKKVLELLQDNNIKYEINGKKLTIKSS